MDWSTFLAIISTFGGLEFLKWVANRRAYARKENAKADDAVLSVHEKQIEHYEQRLAQRDAKVDSIYKELRDEQKHNLELIEKVNKLEFDIEVLILQKCEVRGCTERRPPGVY